MPADLAIQNGTICTPRGTYQADIAVADGRIERIARTVPDADRTVDATDRVVLPGLINTHVHFREPGQTHKEDFETGSKAAAAGGYTMFMDMPNCTPITNTLERYEEKIRLADEKAVIDFNSWAGATDADEAARIYRETGNLGFKLFMHRHPEVEYPYVPELAVYETDRLYAIFDELAGIDPAVPVSIHPSDVPLADELYERLRAMGAEDYTALREGKDGMNMTLGAFEAAFIARLVGLERLNVIHAGFNERVPDPYFDFANRVTILDLVSRLKDWGWDLFVEAEASTFLQRDESITWDRRWYTPDREKLWTAVRDGVIDMAVVEHAPQLEAEAASDDVWEAASGLLGAQDFLPLMLTAVDEGRIDLPSLVELTAETPARFLGIYPRKGAIRVGSDADLTVVDPGRETVIDADDAFSKSGWSSFDGYAVTGVPTHTVVRGEVVYEDGEILADPGYGEFVDKDAYRAA